MLVVALPGVEEIGVGGVHPPCVGAVVEEALEVLPVDVTRHRAESVIHLHPRGVFHHRRPHVRDAALWPCLDGQEQSFLIEFAELLGLRPETCPDADHEMGMLAVDVVNHPPAVAEVLCKEVHRVPKIVGTPILPILDDAVERHLQFAVLVHHALRLSSTFVSLLRLPEAVCPQREHGYVAGEVPHLRHHAIHRTTIHEIVVDALSCLGGECHASLVVIKLCGRVVLPIQPPPFYALQHVLEILQIALLHPLVLATAVEEPVLYCPEAIDSLTLVEGESLPHLAYVATLLPEEHLSLAGEEGEVAVCILFHGEHVARSGTSFTRHGHLFGFCRHHKALGGFSFYHMHDGRRHKLHCHVLGRGGETSHEGGAHHPYGTQANLFHIFFEVFGY